MADELIIKDFDKYNGSCDQNEALRHFRDEATPVTIPPAENETTEQHAQRLEKQRLENDKVKEQKKFYEAAQKHPELAAKLYNIREATRREQKPTIVQMKVDEAGHPYAKIRGQMEGGFFDFSIHDGKIVFGQMNEAQIAEVLMFLYRRGITNFELPAGVDKNFIEKYQKAQEIKNQNPESRILPQGNQASVDFENQSEGYQAAPTQTPTQQQASQSPAPTQPKPIPTFAEVIDDFEKWLGDDNQKKIKGLTYFKHGREFSIYDKPNENNYKNDGRPDKNGNYSECSYRIRLRKKNGHLAGIDYYVPNDGKLPDAVADKLALMVKAQGALYMKLPKTLSPADAGIFRNACARIGVIPKGIGINKFHATKMLTEAENNIQDQTTLYKYKGNLGRHLLSLGNNDPKDPRYELATSLINQEKLFPLKYQLEHCLTDKLVERINKGKAEEVIGAAQTMKQLFTAISFQPDMSVAQLCEKLAPDDTAFQSQLIQKLQAAGAQNKTACSLDDAQMIALFETLETKNIDIAQKTLIDKIRRNKDKDSIDTIVEREVNSANKALNVTINKGLRDKGFKEGFSTIDFGTPTFDAPTNTNTNGRYTSSNTHTGAEL